MSESMRMWVEVLFNIAYLIAVWGLVILMIVRRASIAKDSQPLAKLFIWAFGLLALGDTGHVGFRVWAYSRGSLEETIQIAGSEFGLVGLGALATAITVTLFYLLMVFIWQERFNKDIGRIGYLLISMAFIRFAVMAFPANEWNNVVPPQPWGLYRNLPLMVLGLGVAVLILRDSVAVQDRTFAWVGVMILASYAFYIPVILWVQQVPMLGMLMIPKTLAYVAIAVFAYQGLFIPATETRKKIMSV